MQDDTGLKIASLNTDQIYLPHNARLDEGATVKEIQSDVEDNLECNKVKYSYIDNELFNKN